MPHGRKPGRPKSRFCEFCYTRLDRGPTGKRKREDARYCSPRCRVNAAYERKREQREREYIESGIIS